MPDQTPALWSFAAAVVTSLWPGLVGATLAIYIQRLQSKDAGLPDLAFTGLSSVLLAGIFGPACVELFGIERAYLQAAVSTLAGAFGLVIVGEAVTAIREVGLASFLREGMRRIFGVGGGSGVDRGPE